MKVWFSSVETISTWLTASGIPSLGTIIRVLALIKPAEFQKALLRWRGHLCEMAADSTFFDDKPIHVAIDGKTARGSYTDAEKAAAVHIVSVWAIENGVMLGQTDVDLKPNEITAIPGESPSFCFRLLQVQHGGAVPGWMELVSTLVHSNRSRILWPATNQSHPLDRVVAGP